ncbi:MAG: hypothetical protein M0C28_29935 [Candidatus Moduliflexus flocculans]|nr:hypothetical protein [Candidatus Moduliflexus flocculans]
MGAGKPLPSGARSARFEIGREIQAGFLPEDIPQPQGWEIAALLKSAREGAGDFYDVFELQKDKIGLVIADVCDKGLGAAFPLFATPVPQFAAEPPPTWTCMRIRRPVP